MKEQRTVAASNCTLLHSPRLPMQLRQSQPEESERDRMVSYGSNMAADARKVRVEQLLKVKIGT